MFCRSAGLAGQLAAMGVDARASGNVMMDTIPAAEYDVGRRRLKLQSVLLLPGSREATVANFALQIEALAQLPDEMKPDVFVAVADGINPEDMAKAAGLIHHGTASRERADAGRLSGRGLNVNLARGALKPLLDGTDLVLSQAGTATIQALGSGRPVLTFSRGSDRMKRFEEENLLFGEARQMVAADAGQLSEAVGRLLADPAEMARLGTVGRERIGGPGVIREIIGVLEQIAGKQPKASSLSASR